MNQPILHQFDPNILDFGEYEFYITQSEEDKSILLYQLINNELMLRYRSVDYKNFLNPEYLCTVTYKGQISVKGELFCVKTYDNKLIGNFLLKKQHFQNPVQSNNTDCGQDQVHQQLINDNVQIFESQESLVTVFLKHSSLYYVTDSGTLYMYPQSQIVSFTRQLVNFITENNLYLLCNGRVVNKQEETLEYGPIKIIYKVYTKVLLISDNNELSIFGYANNIQLSVIVDQIRAGQTLDNLIKKFDNIQLHPTNSEQNIIPFNKEQDISIQFLIITHYDVRACQLYYNDSQQCLSSAQLYIIYASEAQKILDAIIVQQDMIAVLLENGQVVIVQ